MSLLCTHRYVPLSCYTAAPRNQIFKFTLHYFWWLEAFGFVDDAIYQLYGSLGSLKERENMLSWLPQQDLKTLWHSLFLEDKIYSGHLQVYIFQWLQFLVLSGKQGYLCWSRVSVVLDFRRKKKPEFSVFFSSSAYAVSLCSNVLFASAPETPFPFSCGSVFGTPH